MLKKVDLERLLRSKNLGNTLLSNSYIDYREKVQVTSTGIDALDEALDGGLPRGELSEIVGVRSSGRMSLLCAVMAAATSRGELVGLIDRLIRSPQARQRHPELNYRISYGSAGIRIPAVKMRRTL